MKIFRARFYGAHPNCSVKWHNNVYCYGETQEGAIKELCTRFANVRVDEIHETPIIKVSQTKVGDYIFMIEKGRLIGDVKPHTSLYLILDTSGTLPGIKVRGAGGMETHLERDLDCIVDE